jgi:hypothetical protein
MREDAPVSEAVEYRACPGCGARFERRPWALDRDLRASPECWRTYGEVGMLCGERLDDPGPLSHLIENAYGAQHVGRPTPPDLVARSLVGLRLALVEKAGPEAIRAVQARMGTSGDSCPSLDPPGPAGRTIADVLSEGTAAGSAAEFEAAVRCWAEEVWSAWAERHDDVAALARRV